MSTLNLRESQMIISNNLLVLNGAKETRTPDPCNAIAVLYQLSYNPVFYSFEL